MNAEIDEIPVAQLADRYGVHRSQVYTRLDALKQRNAELIPYKRGRKAYINSYILQCLDGISALVQQGQTTDEAADQVLGKMPPPSSRADSRADSPVDIRHVEASGIAIAAPNSGVEKEPDFKDLLEMLRGLQEVADNNWWIGTSQLAKALGMKTLPANSFERYGFKFSKAGKNGIETAWKIEKLK